MSMQVKEEVTLHKGNGKAALKEAAAVVDRAAKRKVPSGIKVVAAQELGATMTRGTAIDVPQDLMDNFNMWLEDYKPVLIHQVERYTQRLIEEQRPKIGDVQLAMGQPTTQPWLGCPAGYNAFDVLSFSPFELMITPPPWIGTPDKILRSGGPGTLTIGAFLALVWVNPIPSIACGYAVPPTVQLNGNDLQVNFDVMNLTTVAPGPSSTINLTLGLDPLVIVPTFFVVPPVTSPQLFELNVTADIVQSPQPYSAFATHHVDVDNEISIFGNVPPEIQHDAPNRFMIYPA